jgi:hypothetical protein
MCVRLRSIRNIIYSVPGTESILLPLTHENGVCMCTHLLRVSR